MSAQRGTRQRLVVVGPMLLQRIPVLPEIRVSKSHCLRLLDLNVFALLLLTLGERLVIRNSVVEMLW
jgi:hypothetical protein